MRVWRMWGARSERREEGGAGVRVARMVERKVGDEEAEWDVLREGEGVGEAVWDDGSMGILEESLGKLSVLDEDGMGRVVQAFT
jgi:hypothetical protein